jgi:hypothetical protein
VGDSSARGSDLARAEFSRWHGDHELSNWVCGIRDEKAVNGLLGIVVLLLTEEHYFVRILHIEAPLFTSTPSSCPSGYIG